MTPAGGPGSFHPTSCHKPCRGKLTLGGGCCSWARLWSAFSLSGTDMAPQHGFLIGLHTEPAFWLLIMTSMFQQIL